MIIVISHNPQTGQTQLQVEGAQNQEHVLAVMKQMTQTVEAQVKQTKVPQLIVPATVVPKDVRLPGLLGK